VRVLGVDLGSRRIGVAVSDPGGTIASPVEVVLRSGDEPADHRRLAALAAEWEVTCVVVGMPFTLEGTIGPAAENVVREVAAMRRVMPVPVHTFDERLTTVIANRHLREMGLDNRAARKVVDKLAAAVLLQAWLEAGSPTEPNP
jgi:putative holliday junction resolvase